MSNEYRTAYLSSCLLH